MEKINDEEIDYTAGYAPKIQTDEPWLPKDLWSEILPGLWVGGCDDADTTQELMKGEIRPKPITRKQFDTVVTLYAFANPVSWEVKELRYGYYDAPTMQGLDMETVDSLVGIAHADWKSGKRVGFRCQAGLNRSNLLAVKFLLLEGYSAVEAVALLRAKRSPFCLFNKIFESYLLGLPTISAE